MSASLERAGVLSVTYPGNEVHEDPLVGQGVLSWKAPSRAT
jgi:hypothetical protein